MHVRDHGCMCREWVDRWVDGRMGGCVHGQGGGGRFDRWTEELAHGWVAGGWLGGLVDG